MTHCPACRCPLCPRPQGLTPCSPQAGGGHACGALPASCAPALDGAGQLLSVPCFVRHLRSNASRDRQIRSSVADSWRLGPRSAPLGTQELRSALRSGERRRGCFWWLSCCTCDACVELVVTCTCTTSAARLQTPETAHIQNVRPWPGVREAALKR